MAQPDRVFFRVDGSTNIGLGHVYRCLTLADSLSREGIRSVFVVRDLPGFDPRLIRSRGHELLVLSRQEEDVPLDSLESGSENYLQWLDGQEADAAGFLELIAPLANPGAPVIVDHYGAFSQWHSLVRHDGYLLAAIDDLANRQYEVDLLTDCSPGHTRDDYDGLVPQNCVLLLGSAYTLMSEAFARIQRTRKKSAEVSRVLISMGATDPRGLTEGIVSRLAAGYPDLGFTVVTTGANGRLDAVKSLADQLENVSVLVDVNDMPAILAEVDCAVGAAGMSAWERCAAGIPSLVVPFEANQSMVARAIEQARAAVVLSIDQLDYLESYFGRLIRDSELREELSGNGTRLCDGLGASRVTREVLKLAFKR